MSGLNPVDVVEEDAADLLFPKGSYDDSSSIHEKLVCENFSKEQNLIIFRCELTKC